MISLYLGVAATMGLAVGADDGCSWQAMAPCPQPRFEGLALEVDGLLYVFGGFRSSTIEVTQSVDVFDPQSNTWSVRGNMPTPLTHIVPARDDRLVWFAGGFVGDHPGVATSAVWIYGIDLDAWAIGPALPKPVAGGGLVRVGRNLHYFGGLEADRVTNSPDHFVLDLDNPLAGWSSLAPLPEARNHLAGVELNGLIHAVGGQTGHDQGPIDVAWHHAYDPSTDLWTALAPLPSARSHAETSTFVHAGCIVMCGGQSQAEGTENLPDIVAYSPGTDSWSARPPLPVPSFGAGAAIVGDQLLISTGGVDGFEPDARTWMRPAGLLLEGHWRINCGGGAVTGIGLESWCADNLFWGGQPFANPLVPDVLGTLDDELYRTQRTTAGENLVRYRIPTDPGLYRARFHLAEIEHGATGIGGPALGQRVLRLNAEGIKLEKGLDVAAEVGVEAALVRTHDFFATGTAVDVRVAATVGEPMLNALELVRLDADLIQHVCDGQPTSLGEPAVLSTVGSISIAVNNLTFVAKPVPPQIGLIMYGPGTASLPFGNGTLCASPPLTRLDPVAIPQDELRVTLDYGYLPPNGVITAGSTWVFQAWFRDPPAAPAFFDVSSALQITFTP